MTQICQKQVTIANGQTVSGNVNLEGYQLVGIYVPPEFDGTTLTINAALSLAGTYVAVQGAITASTAIAITTAASRFIPLDNLMWGLQFIQLVAGSQTGDTVLTLILRNRS